MTPSAPAPTEEQRIPASPWDKFGWLMGVVWLVFLVFPLLGAWELDHPLPRWTGIALVAVFAVLYVAGFSRALADTPTSRRVDRMILAGLVVLFALTYALVGMEAAGMTNYLIAFSLFLKPTRAAFVLAGTWLLVTTALVLASGDPGRWWFYIVINVLTGAFLTLIVVIGNRQEQHDQVVNDRNVIAERERVARDVHDVLGHSLTVVTVRAELAERLVDSDPEAAKAELAQLRALTREALGEVRATVAGLRVVRLSDELDSARLALRGAGIEAQLPEGPDAVDPRRRLVLAWVLREAVTNVLRHSQANRCQVVFHPEGMVVSDNGVGCGPGDADSTGLRGVRERVVGAGGQVSITAADPHDPEFPGTRLEVSW
ncbi:sensor histidine kinase [Bogoriella caseilytica]|uniref:Two-component system sensor histidine kinase DesK n=1 Tax=Bogoriella caseilytica TaxID=56055 RepID=A0A3N2BB48_9MICO|nr:sensor histidine kinase [Bogoriella caseilytica]ROR72477.1 two-component system sensor histidine kinase DesK [Bogoriella caseilytica]